MMIFRLIICALAMLAPAAALAGPLDLERIDARLNRLMEEPGMVGLAVVIIEDGELVHVKGYGETLAQSGDPVTEETVFRWASLSKSVAGTMITTLSDQGKLALNEPASLHAKSLRLPGRGEDAATLQNVLSHQMGIVRNAYDNRLEGGANPYAIRGALSELPLLCEVGTCHGYQNVAFDAAAEVVESVLGESYDAAVKRALFDPLGMRSATMSLAGLQHSPRWARPHNRQGFNVYRKMRESYYRVPAAGGVNSNIRDLGLWMRAQMGEASAVVTPAMQEAMHHGYVNTPREARRARRFFPRLTDAQYGLGWRVYDYGGRKVVGHRGAVNGYRAMMLFDPESKVGVAALWNSGSNQPVGLQMEVLDAAYGLPAQDWLYLDDGPDLSAVRAANLAFARAPEVDADFTGPRLSPKKCKAEPLPRRSDPAFIIARCYSAWIVKGA